jgi:hypothetical protein
MRMYNSQLFFCKNVESRSCRNRLYLILLVCFVFLPFVSHSQNTYKGFPSLVWPKLYDIKFEKATDDLGEYDKPIFSNAAKSLNGKTISLPGYMVPFENGMKGDHFMFTSLPLNACFFCGVGGPETVVEVFTKYPVTYTEKPIEIRGTLKLNSTNADQMIYLIEGAEVTGEVDF